MRISLASGRVLRLLAFVAFLAFLGSGFGVVAAGAAARPHVIYFLADDLGWADVGFHGNDIKTPHLDRLAAAGTRLDSFYVQHVCSPTRAALLTGRYPIRYGLQTGVVQRWSHYGLPLEERTLPQALREVGYRTVMIGKWHLGSHTRAMLPLQRGFDYHYGFYTGAIDYYTRKREETFDWHRNGQVCRDEGYATHLLAREAVQVIEQHAADTPLFLYMAFSAPHTPHQVPAEYLKPYVHMNEKRRIYAGMIAAMDEAIGAIVAALERKGVRDNTLFIFSSDNGGDSNGEVASNAPLRGKKGTLYEGGTRVPSFATWAGRISPGTINREPLHIVDWYPTLLRLAGASLEQPLPLDGRDIWPTLTAGKLSPHDAILINSAAHNAAIRIGDWKLVLNGDATDDVPKFGKQELVELFDLRRDPGEQTNLAGDRQEKVAQLRAALAQFEREAVPSKYEPRPDDFKAPAIAGDFGPSGSVQTR